MKLPTVLLLNGLLQYQPALLTPLAPMASDLRELGFRVITDTHFAFSVSDEEPVAIIGHSRGGGAALRMAERLRSEVKYEPLVITFDAVPVMRCPVRICINFQSKEYKLLPIPGAKNIDADLPFLPLFSHSYLPLSPHVRARVRVLLKPLARPMD